MQPLGKGSGVILGMAARPFGTKSMSAVANWFQIMVWAPKILLLGLLVAAFSIRAHAAATLSVYDGVNPLITVVDNGPGDGTAVPGAILVQTNVGVWYLSISSAETKPLLGGATDPVMDLLVSASSSAAGSLRLTFSDNDFGPARGTLIALVDGHIVAGAAATVTYDVYGDPANVVGAATIHIASTGTTALPTSVTGPGLLTLPTPFSLTQVLQFNAAGATILNSDASFQVVPEPGVMGLGALGLAVFALGRSQRRQT